MKLLMLTENWPPHVGGIENYLWHIANYLAVNGHEVTVVALKHDHEFLDSTAEKSGEESLFKVITSSGSPKTGRKVAVIRKRFYNKMFRPRWLRLYWWIKKRAQDEKFDAVLCGKGLFEGLVGYLIKQKLGIPYVIFTYGMEIERWRQHWREKKKLRMVTKEASAVFCLNDQIRDSLKQIGVNEQKIVKAWPGVDDIIFSAVAEEDIVKVLKKYDIRRPYVIGVGRLIERKGWDELIAAFARLDQTEFGNTSLVIVGDGPQLSALQKAVERELIDPAVLFLPEVPNADLPALYAGAVLFALTPKPLGDDIEGFGIVYLEAAAQGVPAVATRTGGIPEAVIDGGTGIIVESGETQAIEKAMAKILRDKNFREKLGRAAQERAREKFTWEERIKVIEQAILGIVAQ